MNAGLGAREAQRVDADLAQRHRQQRAGDDLARGEQHVHLPLRRSVRHLPRQRDQLIGGVPHRGDHDHQIVSLQTPPRHSPRDVPDPLRVADGTTTVFLDDQAHVAF